jgi:hypothetical protein
MIILLIILLLIIVVTSVWMYKVWEMFDNIKEIKKTICDKEKQKYSSQ